MFKTLICLKQHRRAKYSTIPKNKLFSATIQLPKTKLPLHLDKKKYLEREELLQKKGKFGELYSWQQGHLSEPEFILHDGPPYANGTPHMGHAINKILKDTILRYRLLNGCKVHYVPGWDCHGLPIELKALTSSDDLKDSLEIRKKARLFAKNTIEKQKKTFQSWGIVGDWNNAYHTYSNDYIKNEFRQFFKLYKKNVIYRSFKPIYWSPSSKTALAEAELEYNDFHKSSSLYVKLEVVNLPELLNVKNNRTFVIIWTTTPWSLPSNQAVIYNPSLSYTLVQKNGQDDIFIICTELIDKLSKLLKCEFQILDQITGEVMSKMKYRHPIYKDQILKFIPASCVSVDKGSGLVHCAPAHGPDDFLVALENKLPIVDLVNEEGCYKREAGCNLEGKFVLKEGNEAILKLISNETLLLDEITHSYPYDWRTKKPVIIKASRQWFIDTESIKDSAVDIVKNIRIVPELNNIVHKKNFINQIQKRPYWCISRQRKWGVPIPVFYEKESGKTILNEDIIDYQCQLLEKYGADFWWKLPEKELIPEHIKNEVNPDSIEKGKDILDIWFDSGISWSKVLDGNKVADLYVEGVDQLTGWFQSSLLTSVAIRNKSPYKAIYVHGFAVDDKGLKMSKSLGNVIDPDDIVYGKNGKKQYGIDTLRWWVVNHASQCSTTSITDNVLKASADDVQKIRTILRFILGALHGYEPHRQDYNTLCLIDKYMLHVLSDFHKQGKLAIEEYQFNKIGKLVLNLLTNPVSALYYTSTKDRLYCDRSDSASRTTAQFILHQIFEIVGQIVAPIVPHLIEEMYLYLPSKTGKTYFTSKHCMPLDSWENKNVENIMDLILKIKSELHKQLGSKTIDSSLDITLSTIVLNNVQNEISMEDLEFQLTDILQVSEVHIHSISTLSEEFKLDFVKSGMFSCPRCRKVNTVMEDALCARCNNVVQYVENKIQLNIYQTSLLIN